MVAYATFFLEGASKNFTGSHWCECLDRGSIEMSVSPDQYIFPSPPLLRAPEEKQTHPFDDTWRRRRSTKQPERGELHSRTELTLGASSAFSCFCRNWHVRLVVFSPSSRKKKSRTDTCGGVADCVCVCVCVCVSARACACVYAGRQRRSETERM